MTRPRFVVAGCPDPHFLESNRVEYWRSVVGDGPGDETGLGFHGFRQIDPLVGVAPMPYVGIFMENEPPETPGSGPILPQTLETHIYGERTVTGTGESGHNGPVTIHDVGAVDGDLAIAIICMTNSAAPQNDSGVYASSTLWSLPNVALMPNIAGIPGNDGGATRCEVWTASLHALWDPDLGESVIPFDHTFTVRSDTGGYDLSVHYFRLRNCDGPVWTDLPLTGTTQVPTTTPDGGWMQTGHALHPVRDGGIFISMAINTMGAGGAGQTWPPGGPPPITEFEVQHHYVTSMPPMSAGLPTYGIDIIVDERTEAHTTDTSPVSFLYGWDEDSPTLAVSRGLALEQLQETPPTIYSGPDAANVYGDVTRVLLASVKLATDTDILYPDGTSLLLPSRLVRDAVRHTRLSQDLSLITDGGTVIESFAAADPISARELCEAANAVDAFRMRIALDRRVVYEPLPTEPAYELRDEDGIEFTDASGASLESLVNASYVTGQDQLGRPILDKRGLYDIDPSKVFDVDESDVGGAGWDLDAEPPGGWWRVLLGSSVWTGGVWQLWTSPPLDGEGSAVALLKMGEGFVVGREYVVTINVRALDALWTDGVNGLFRLYVYAANYTQLAREMTILMPDTSPHDVPVSFIATDPWMHLYLVASSRGSGEDPVHVLNFEHFSMQRVENGILDRRGLRRTKVTQVSRPLSPKLTKQVNQAYLAEAHKQVFKGSVVVRGAAARRTADASRVPASELLDAIDELVWLADRIDPETGTAGRAARIVAASYDADQDAVTLTLDNSTSRLDRVTAYLERPTPNT